MGVIITIGMAFVELFMMMVEFFVAIFMDILPILEFILWLIIRVIILILVWIEFVFALLITISLFLIIVGLLFALRIFLNINIDTNINKIEVQGDVEILISYKIGWDDLKFLNLIIPKIEVYFNAFDFTFTYRTSFILEDLEFTELPENFLDSFKEEGPNQSSKEIPKMSSDSNKNIIKGLVDFITGVGIAWGIAGGFVGSIAALLLIVKKAYRETSGWQEKLITLIGLSIYTASMIIMIFTILENSFASALGLGMGFLTAGLWFWNIGDYMKSNKYKKYMDRWKNGWLFKIRGNHFSWKGIFEIIDVIGGFVGLIFDIESVCCDQWKDEVKTYDINLMMLSLGTGIIALILAKNALLFFGSSDQFDELFYGWRQPTKTKFSKFFSIVSILFGTICFGIAVNRYFYENQ